MPNIVNLLNGMISLIKYGLGDCNNGFGLYPGFSSCNDNGQYLRSFGHLFYETPVGSTDLEMAEDLSLLLTSGRLSTDQLNNTIVPACSTESDAASKNRCMTQLIITSGEFHSTNVASDQIVEDATSTSEGQGTGSNETDYNEGEPYKATVYFYLGGGLDSYHMLAPHTCSPIDVYANYRSIRGRRIDGEGVVVEGVGLPLSRLLEIPANNANQPCQSFGINEGLPVLKELYDNSTLTFIANAGLMAKPVDVDK